MWGCSDVALGALQDNSGSDASFLMHHMHITGLEDFAFERESSN